MQCSSQAASTGATEQRAAHLSAAGEPLCSVGGVVNTRGNSGATKRNETSRCYRVTLCPVGQVYLSWGLP